MIVFLICLFVDEMIWIRILEVQNLRIRIRNTAENGLVISKGVAYVACNTIECWQDDQLEVNSSACTLRIQQKNNPHAVFTGGASRQRPGEEPPSRLHHLGPEQEIRQAFTCSWHGHPAIFLVLKRGESRYRFSFLSQRAEIYMPPYLCLAVFSSSFCCLFALFFSFLFIFFSPNFLSLPLFLNPFSPFVILSFFHFAINLQYAAPSKLITSTGFSWKKLFSIFLIAYPPFKKSTGRVKSRSLKFQNRNFDSDIHKKLLKKFFLQSVGPPVQCPSMGHCQKLGTLLVSAISLYCRGLSTLYVQFVILLWRGFIYEKNHRVKC